MSYYSVEQTVLWRVPAVALLRKFAEQFGVTDSLPDEHVAEAAWKAASNACKEAGYRTERDGKAPHVVSHVMKWKWHNLNLELERAVTAAHALDVHDTTPIHYLGG
jgi:hypothetical protein